MSAPVRMVLRARARAREVFLLGSWLGRRKLASPGSAEQAWDLEFKGSLRQNSFFSRKTVFAFKVFN